MPSGTTDIRMRILAIERMLSEKPYTVPQLRDKLERDYNITCDRKTVYADINAVTFFLPIKMKKKNDKYYYGIFEEA